MAFKILSSDELELLTENQRKSYEKELDIYNERVRFVEQMERLENAVITVHEPEFPAIPAVCKVPENEFIEPEYVLAKIAPIEKPEPNVTAVRFGDPVTAVVPKHAKIKNIPVGHMKEVEQIKPALPIILKAAAPANSFARAKQQHPILPTSMKINIPGNIFKKSEQANLGLPIPVKPQNFTGLFSMSTTINSSAIVAKTPELAALAIERLKFSAPEHNVPILPKPAVELPKVGVLESPKLTAPALPKPTVEFPKVSILESPELTVPVLPKVTAPKQMNVSLKVYDLDKQVDKIEAKLPKTPHITLVDAVFCKPDIQKMKLPVVPKDTPKAMISKQVNDSLKKMSERKIKLPKTLAMPTVQVMFGKPDIQKTELPSAQKAIIPTREFTTSEHAISDLPMVGIPKASVPSFTAPELQKPAFFTVMKPAVAPKIQGKLSVSSTPKVEYPSINVFSVKPFKKIHGKASGLPAIHVADSPDVCAEELLKILLPSQKENEIRKGSFA